MGNCYSSRRKAKSKTARESTASKDMIVIHFDEESSSGHLFIESLGRGQDGEAVLLQNVDTGELVVRKFPRQCESVWTHERRQTFLSSQEVAFHQALTHTGFTPKFISLQGSEQFPESLTMEFANGGTAWDYFHAILATEARPIREAFQWLLLAEGLRAFAFLHSGHRYVPPSSQRWVDRIPRGKLLPPDPEHQPWPGFIHGDMHMSNVFLSFPSEHDVGTNTPQILIADFSRMKHTAAFPHFEALDAEFCDVEYFLDSFSNLHTGGRALPVIRRMTKEIRQRLDKGAKVLDMVKAGLYDECMANFRELRVTFPRPKGIPAGGKPRVFDLQAGRNYTSDFWALKGLVDGNMTHFKTLGVRQEDMLECGNVDIRAATEVSRSELEGLLGIRRDGDDETELGQNDVVCKDSLMDNAEVASIWSPLP